MNIRRRMLWRAAQIMFTAAMAAAFTFGAALPNVTTVAFAKKLPKTFAWTAYGVKSSGYAQSVAIGNALSAKGHKLRVVPGKNDISRMAPLRAGMVHFSAMGVGSYLAQEGVQDFGAPSWGPQPLRLIMASWANTNTGNLPTAKDAGIRKMSDMRGKRVAWVVGSPALNSNLTSFLAFGGLTWDDVVIVKVPGFGASMKGLIEGTIDAAVASTDSSRLYELNSSPRGLFFPPTPHNDKAGWARLNKVAPWFQPHIATAGAGLSKSKTHEGASYGYPILIAYTPQDSQMVYELTKLLHTEYDKYKDGHPGGVGWAMERQVFKWILPYHKGAIRYFKEIGVWKDDHQLHNDSMVKRQQVLASAWKATRAKKSGGSDYLSFWMGERASALKSAGFDPIWSK
ncbi:MAG: TAXI family TRAP transporter solute-binding subunit [bacterium]